MTASTGPRVRQLAAKRERLEELQRAGRRPNVKRVRETDVVTALTRLRELLQEDEGVAAQVLKALVGGVIIETRQVEGQDKPKMVARFLINAVPALAALDRAASVASNDAPKDIWAGYHAAQSAENQRAEAATRGQTIVSLAYDRTEAARKAARNRDGAA